VHVSEVQALVYEEYKKNGYLERWNKAEKVLNETMGAGEIASLAEIGLFSTEKAESMEALRDKDEKGELGSELADIIIRVLNFASRKGLDMERELLRKHERNMAREHLHGRHI